MSLLDSIKQAAVTSSREDDLLYRLMQSQQLVAALVETYGGENKTLAVSFEALQKVMEHPQVKVVSDLVGKKVELTRAT